MKRDIDLSLQLERCRGPVGLHNIASVGEAGLLGIVLRILLRVGVGTCGFFGYFIF